MEAAGKPLAGRCTGCDWVLPLSDREARPGSWHARAQAQHPRCFRYCVRETCTTCMEISKLLFCKPKLCPNQKHSCEDREYTGSLRHGLWPKNQSCCLRKKMALILERIINVSEHRPPRSWDSMPRAAASARCHAAQAENGAGRKPWTLQERLKGVLNGKGKDKRPTLRALG